MPEGLKSLIFLAGLGVLLFALTLCLLLALKNCLVINQEGISVQGLLRSRFPKKLGWSQIDQVQLVTTQQGAQISSVLCFCCVDGRKFYLRTRHNGVWQYTGTQTPIDLTQAIAQYRMPIDMTRFSQVDESRYRWQRYCHVDQREYRVAIGAIIMQVIFLLIIVNAEFMFINNAFVIYVYAGIACAVLCSLFFLKKAKRSFSKVLAILFMALSGALGGYTAALALVGGWGEQLPLIFVLVSEKGNKQYWHSWQANGETSSEEKIVMYCESKYRRFTDLGTALSLPAYRFGNLAIVKFSDFLILRKY